MIKKKEASPILNGLYTPFVLLPFGQWVFDKSPPFPGDRNPEWEGAKFELRIWNFEC